MKTVLFVDIVLSAGMNFRAIVSKESIVDFSWSNFTSPETIFSIVDFSLLENSLLCASMKFLTEDLILLCIAITSEESNNTKKKSPQ